MSDKKWSTADKDTQLIFEGWNNFLNEEKDLNEKWQGFKALGRTLTGQDQPDKKLQGYYEVATSTYNKALLQMNEDVEVLGGEETVTNFVNRSKSERKKLEALGWRDAHKAAMQAPKGTKISSNGRRLGRAIGEVLQLWDEHIEMVQGMDFHRKLAGREGRKRTQQMHDQLQELIGNQREQLGSVSRAHR